MDCLEAMKQMPDNAFDLAVVDPPYGDGSQVVQVERERERETGRGTASVEDSTGTSRPPAQFQTAARERERDADGTGKERTADSQTERGVMRTGGTWAEKYTKKSSRGTSRRGQSILRNCSASHETRLYGAATIFLYRRQGVFWYGES